ncbi:MAG: SDR family NAD(P)-dependent oxidoreductase [Phycisphaerae bacterium]|jgi:sorbitol-6-phosphate 2-dehydrogenase
MSKEVNQSILRIAPLLRGLWGSCGKLPLVRFTKEFAANDSINVEMYPEITDDELIAQLRQPAASGSSVTIAGVGRFDLIEAGNACGRAGGKVAIVTGAAQGFGLEIAQDLAEQGAYVVLADLNIEQAEKEAAALREQYGADRAHAVLINVTGLDSITNAVTQVLRVYGGFDVLVANAGVLKAGSVKRLSEKDFDFVTSVNYKGYFLCTQVCSKVLAAQHRAHEAFISDIIQINSKSGLVGSNKNGAYAGGKFGGIGLTQSFALELIEDGIKVNSVCPGNFFDGPLWSNPENGLFVQYLRTGKVPGAKTIEDVKHFYEAKVPMKRGCTTKDVMAAVYYLIEQKYETGQAVPVTGGQVMLH